MSGKKIIFILLFLPVKILRLLFIRIKPDTKHNSLIILANSNSYGAVLSSRSAIRALKTENSDLRIILLVKSKYIEFFRNDEIMSLFGFDENDEVVTLLNFKRLTFGKFDIALVPSFEKFSLFSHFIAGLICRGPIFGFSNFNGNANPYRSVLSSALDADDQKNADLHTAELLCKLLESSSLKCDDPFGEISFFNAPVPSKELVFDKYKIDSKSMVVGIYNEGNRISQKWDNEKIVELILDLQKKGNFNFFFLGTNQDETLNKLMENKGLKYNFIHLVEQIPILPFICRSDLLITPNSNLMHLAGITDTPQISLFGSYNPFRWAPIGKNKIFIKKSDFVNSISTNDVIKQIDKLLESDDGKN